MKKVFATVVAAVVACGWAFSGIASAVPYYYVDWQTANPGAGTASGVITLPDSSTVNVGFQALNANGSPGSFLGAYLGNNFGGFSAYPSTYTSAEVSNYPNPGDLLQLVGGQNQIYRVTLSEAIKDPLMAIVSLGSGWNPTTYDFDSPFTILSQGANYWGGDATRLTQLPGDILRGVEGNGTLRFNGTFSTFSWTVPTGEYWHGFTFGIRTTERIEPTVSAVPEPGTWLLLGSGLVGLAVYRKRFARK